MRTRLLQGSLGLAMAVLLAGCGVTASGSGCQNVANSAPTISQGLVTIATDHGAYATTSDIVATVTNKTGQPIYAYNHQAGCTILAVQQQVNGEWVAPSKQIVGCSMGVMTGLVELAPGKAYIATLHAGLLRRVAWPAGTYRLALTYFASRTDIAQSNNGTTVYSQPLTILDCGGTPAATSGSSGVPVVTAQPGAPVTVTPQSRP